MPVPQPSQSEYEASEVSSSPSAYDLVQDFFRYKPPVLKAPVVGGHTDSVGTRVPGPFDKHFPDVLRLKRVVKLPSIVSDLADLAQRTLDSYQGELPPTDDNFPSKKIRSRHIQYSAKDEIYREEGVGGFYNATTAKFCEVVAGTLAFNLPKWSRGNLLWALSEISKAKKDGLKRNQAVADGFLNVVATGGAENPLQDFPVLIPYEFKNLNFARRGTVLGTVVDRFLHEGFPWEGCEFGEECSIAHDVGITGCRMGHDAEDHPCPSFRTARTARATQLDGPTPDASNHSSSFETFPKTPRHILQQAWSEAVRHDATFIVIDAGNLEIICIRDRKNQTLYVSNVIDTSGADVQYGKLHTGLYIAAIRDAEDRARLLKVSTPATWVMKFGIPVEKQIDFTKKSRETVCQMLWHEAFTRPYLKILPDPKAAPVNYHPYMKDRLYLRYVPGEPSKILTVRDTNTFFRLLANSSFDGHLICRADIDIPGAIFSDHQKRKDFKLNKTVVLKNASRPHEIARLEKEYHVYRKLRDAGITAIPKVFGFFTGSDKDGYSFAALVLEDVGRSLEQLEKDMKGRVPLSKQQRILFETALHDIHKANFVHGNLTSKSLMFRNGRDSEDVSILGFADAEPLPHLLVPPRLERVDTRFSPAITSQREAMIRRDLFALLQLCTNSQVNPRKRKAVEPESDVCPFPPAKKGAGSRVGEGFQRAQSAP
ncbi:hypothetical protein LshimejAT787_1301110 [Lyophyllum shimeji]|uniref:Protein kinase domain-containing protein n=1 Tax=Lyophyllum shimeji TaxID=47721 RepID=A0A9P3UT48_LYOSH|nr:hypothetical protein LshimejAT787_1301110 [Lyophyllum shimeji]